MQNSPIEIMENGVFEKSPEIEIKNDISKMFDTNRYGKIELLIIKSLYKYEYLSINDLKKILSHKLKPSLQKPKYTTNINLLLREGHIAKAIYKTEKETGITIYFLSETTYLFIRQKYKNKQVTYDGNITLDKPCDVLEKIAINQFHIDVLVTKAEKIKKETYCSKRLLFKRRMYFPSNIEIKLDKGTCQLIAIPYGKKESIKELVSQLEKIDEIAVSQHICKMYPIIICSSIESIKEAYKRLDMCVETPPQTMFVLERDCAIGNVLSKLITIEKEGNVIIMERCELI